MIPGELKLGADGIEINQGRKTLSIRVENSGDRPVQVGSHYHFYETNLALVFERESTWGYHLNIAAGTAVRFEPGQARTVELTQYSGKREVYGFHAAVMGKLEKEQDGHH